MKGAFYDEFFVDLQTAKQLKKVGFNRPCIGYFLPDNLGNSFNFNHINSEMNAEWLTDNEQIGYLRPTKKQAFDFLFKMIDHYFPDNELRLFSDKSGTLYFGERDYDVRPLTTIEFNNEDEMFSSMIEILKKQEE